MLPNNNHRQHEEQQTSVMITDDNDAGYGSEDSFDFATDMAKNDELMIMDKINYVTTAPAKINSR